MKKLFMFAMVASLAMGAASCGKETGNGKKNSGFGKEAIVQLYLDIPENNTTRSLTGNSQAGDTNADGGNENLVSVLEFYVFDDTGANRDPKVFMTDAATDPGYYKITVADLADSDKWPYKTQMKMSAGAAKQIIVVANAGLGALATETTFENVMGKITNAVMTPAGVSANTRKVPAAGFEMSGYVLDAEVIAERGDNKITVEVARLVNRIEAPVTTGVTMALDENELARLVEVYGLDPEDIQITNGDVTFAQTGWAVINGLSRSSVGFAGNDTRDWKHPYFNASKGETEADLVPWNRWISNVTINGVLTAGAFETARAPRHISSSKENIENNNTGESSWQNVYSGISAGSASWFLDGSVTGDRVVYAYESKPGTTQINNVTGIDADNVISFIIKGTLTSSSNAVTRYWRVNLLPDDAYHLMRNAVYKTRITKINTLGYKTPQEAEESVDILPEPGETVAEFIIDVLDWDINEYETEM